MAKSVLRQYELQIGIVAWKIGLLGLGTVGRGTAAILLVKQPL